MTWCYAFSKTGFQLMETFSDFLKYGYQIERELSQNRAGGRVTYQAIDLKNQQIVVIKQFQFAKTDSSWAEYEACDREIQTLQGLDHPNIPSYLNSFQTSDGFCIVQEYKHASSLATPRSFSPQDIRKITIALLEILVYLQNRIPPIIHRDIKPENILVDEQMNVYLVDFGFARIGDGNVGVSSVVKGTLGFMPPEQLFNRQLTEASDLYSLGITIICLLTGTKSIDVGNLIDITYRINFKHLVSKISNRWIHWLEKMVEPRLKDRYANAAEALAALPEDLILPEAIFSQANLNVVAQKRGEKLTQTIAIRNTVPQTVLEGSWEVAPHPHDPPHTPHSHPWIAFHPRQFSGNEIECEITINTRYLMSDKLYSRQILLHTNASTKTYSLPLRVQTAPLPHATKGLPYGTLALLSLFSVVVTWFLSWMAIVTSSLLGSPATIPLTAIVGITVGFELAAWILAASGLSVGAMAGVITGMFTGVSTIVLALNPIETPTTGLASLVAVILGIVGGILGGIASGLATDNLIRREFSSPFAIVLALLTTIAGACLGLGAIVSLTHPILLSILLGTSLPLVVLLLHLPLRRAKFIADFRRAERLLIKP